MRLGVKNLAAIIILSAVAACAPPPVKVAPPPIIIPPPPPPPPPAMPLPPGGAASSMTIPPIGVDGVRVTPNRLLTPDENIWHFRSAVNVAALNCQGPVWGQIAVEYNKFIVLHKTRLSQVGKAIDRAYVVRYPGQNGLRVRDSKMTDLYNYFALPPVKAEFCDTSLRRVIEVNTLPSAMLTDFSPGALAELDGVFIRFFDAYLLYERNLADWNLKYAPPSAIQPVFVPNAQPATPQPVFVPNAQPATPQPVFVPNAQPVTPQPVFVPNAQPVTPQPVFAPNAQPVAPQPVFVPNTQPVTPQPVIVPSPQPATPQPVFVPNAQLVAPQPVFVPSTQPVTPQPIFVPSPQVAPQPLIVPNVQPAPPIMTPTVTPG